LDRRIPFNDLLQIPHNHLRRRADLATLRRDA
jgi:hypothetical protein